ncbi:DUF1003 domain-containing protein [Prosthecobacter sp. SYSU 5D2]|uniref:DUF1003 domain-containing protein n=1 Tax=Prosthecobacter sp. SYSU 5D2 TaxID=3134134 RepID=UPI0031FF1AE0
MAQTCAVTGKVYSSEKLRVLAALPPQIAGVLREKNPELTDNSLIGIDALNEARLEYVRQLLQTQLGDLSHLDEEVLQSLRRQEVLSEHPAGEEDENGKLTVGQKLSDKLAEFGGSWTFIMSFGGFMAVWILLNVLLLANHGYDPYPFILLNLILSCLASLQAPVIMMSQNRQESRDRKRAENDYKINLKAELEIRHLHDKMDYLLHQHATRLMEVQQIQLELLREMAKGRNRDAKY